MLRLSGALRAPHIKSRLRLVSSTRLRLGTNHDKAGTKKPERPPPYLSPRLGRGPLVWCNRRQTARAGLCPADLRSAVPQVGPKRPRGLTPVTPTQPKGRGGGNRKEDNTKKEGTRKGAREVWRPRALSPRNATDNL